MLNRFLNDLDHELRILRKKERHKYIEQYEELVLEKMDNEIDEVVAVKELGNISIIAAEILESYFDSDNMHKRNTCKYLNPIYFLGDISIVFLVNLVTWIIYLSFFTYSSPELIWMCIISLLCFIPLYTFFYYLYGLYTVKVVSEKKLTLKKIGAANITGTIVAFIIVFIAGLFHYPRIVLLFFMIGNIIFSSLFRNLIHK